MSPLQHRVKNQIDVVRILVGAGIVAPTRNIGLRRLTGKLYCERQSTWQQLAGKRR